MRNEAGLPSSGMSHNSDAKIILTAGGPVLV
jgi:hypothetical protein